MKFKYLIFLLFSFTLLFGETNELTSLKEDRINVLRYGIDDEVVAVINAIQGEKNYSYNDELLDILVTTGNSKIILPIINFFQSQESDLANAYANRILREATEDYDVDQRVLLALITYIGEIQNMQSVEYLYDLSKSTKTIVAAEAIRALGKSGDSSFAEQFLTRLIDEDFEDDESTLRENIILLFGEIKYDDAVNTLIDIVQDDSYSSVARRYACDSLGKIGNPIAISVLKELLNDPDSILRAYVLTSLAYFDTEEIENILIQALRDSFWRIRVAACKSLSERKSINAVQILIYKAERDPEVNVQKAAMKALAEIGGNKAWSFLSDYYSNEKKSDAMRSIALISLLEEKPSKASESMKKVFEKDWEEESSWLLNFTCKSLSTTEDTSLFWFYSKMLNHKNYIIRIYAIRGIRLNNLLTLYGKVKDIADNEDEHRQLRKEAASL